jgi:hypothetical protein
MGLVKGLAMGLEMDLAKGLVTDLGQGGSRHGKFRSLVFDNRDYLDCLDQR